MRTKRSPKKERDTDDTNKQEQISQLERELNMERQTMGETISRKHISDNQISSILDRRHLEDVTNHQQQQQMQQQQSQTVSSGNENRQVRDNSNKALIIDDALTKLDPVSFLFFFLIPTSN